MTDFIYALERDPHSIEFGFYVDKIELAQVAKGFVTMLKASIKK